MLLVRCKFTWYVQVSLSYVSKVNVTPANLVLKQYDVNTQLTDKALQLEYAIGEREGDICCCDEELRVVNCSFECSVCKRAADVWD